MRKGILIALMAALAVFAATQLTQAQSAESSNTIQLSDGWSKPQLLNTFNDVSTRAMAIQALDNTLAELKTVLTQYQGPDPYGMLEEQLTTVARVGVIKQSVNQKISSGVFEPTDNAILEDVRRLREIEPDEVSRMQGQSEAIRQAITELERRARTEPPARDNPARQ